MVFLHRMSKTPRLRHPQPGRRGSSWWFPILMTALFLTGLPELRSSETSEVDRVFARFDRPDSPGCALGVIRDGEIVYFQGYGLANLEYRMPITSRSTFRIGSTSKQFTAMAIALLAEEGRISLDSDIREYLPEMPDYETPVTVRHMVHHTSGLRDYLTLMSLAGVRGADYYTDAQVVEMLARQQELNFEPGDQFLYSNSGYFLLAEIVKRRSGRSLKEYAEDRIFAPLRMKGSHFHNDHKHVVRNRASGYRRTDDGGFEISMTTLEMIGDGGVFTSIQDLLIWDRNFYDNQLGSPDLMSTMHRQGVLSSGEELDYAFGLNVGTYRGLRTVRHGGAFVGFRAELLRFPDERFSVACLCNLAQTNPSQLANRVADIYLKDRLTAAKDAGKTPEVAPAEFTPDEALPVEGDFRGEDGTIARIRSENRKLYLGFMDGRKFELGLLGPGRFGTRNAPQSIEVVFESPSGGSRRIALRSGERQTVLLEEIEMVSPGPEALAKYAGSYVSPELGVSYLVALEGGRLQFRLKDRSMKGRWMEPTVVDEFYADGLTLRFKRDDATKVVSGLSLDAGRVRNIGFGKQGDSRR